MTNLPPRFVHVTTGRQSTRVTPDGVTPATSATGRKRPRSATPTSGMRVLVRRAGLDKPIELKVCASTTVQQLKESAALQCRCDAAVEDVHLVWGGSVLRDDCALADVALEPSSVLLLLVPSAKALAAQPCLLESARSGLGIFPVGCDEPHQLQESIAPACAQLLSSFADNLTHASAPWTPSSNERAALREAIGALQSTAPAFKAAPHVTWFGEYGCALLASVARVGDVHLQLVSLDGWAFRMHSGLTRRTHTADARGTASLDVGSIALEDYADFMIRADSLLEKAAERRGDKRSAAANDQGNQKTPAMVQAVLVDAMAQNDDGQTAPRGGLTDVGLHTGGLKRNTSWPLIRAVLEDMLEGGGLGMFFRHVMAQLMLWLAEAFAAAAVAAVASEASTSNRGDHQQLVDSCMQALKAACAEGAILSDEQTHVRDGAHRKLDMDDFQARCVLVRWQLEQLVSARAQSIASGYTLPVLSKSQLPCSNMKLSPPPLTAPAHGAEGLSAARSKAESNLGWLPEYPNAAADFGKYDCLGLGWLKKPLLKPGAGDAPALLVLETLERQFFVHAAMLSKGGQQNYEKDEAYSRQWTATVEEMVDHYRLVAASFRRSPNASSLLSVELNSRELLVVWCAYCFVHKATLPFEHRVLAGFGVSLDPNDLRHLVLSEKPAIEAAQHVVAYLRKHTTPQPVFSLLSDDATFTMAAQHSAQSPAARNLWAIEEREAASRQDAHWRIIQQKQARLQELDAQIKREQAKLTEACNNRNCYTQPHRYTSAENDRKYRQYDSEADGWIRKIQETKRLIEQTEKPPSAVFQPLPKDADTAKPILFFLQMPPHFQVLSRLSFVAQQMLLPASSKPVVISGDASGQREVDVASAIDVTSPKTSWRDYYLTGSTDRHLSESSTTVTKVLLNSYNQVPQSSIFSPANVRNFHAPTDGIWHPDGLGPQLMWTGGAFALDSRGGYFNAFAALPDDVLVAKFTEPLGDAKMQWAMLQHGAASEPSRGNVPEARQDIRPAWLAGKPELFAFSAMRAYPLQQVRKLCVALRERSLPFEQPEVRTLLRQTLYQLGELSDGDQPRPKWRTDLVAHEGWEVLRLELEGLADELKLKPRQHSAVLILGELAAHASQWDSETRNVARAFAQIACEWAGEDIESAAPEKKPFMRARRCIFSMYAICCHGAGELSKTDVEELCKAILLADYSRLFEDPSPLDKTVHALTTVTQAVVARRLPELLAALDADSSPLTAAAKLVLEALTPDALSWTRVRVGNEKTVCYEAVSCDGHLFSINILTGVVLYDGLPPSRLPKTILEQPLYKRTFADRNFEVVKSSSGVLETVRHQGGFQYAFFEDAAGKLVATEIDPRNPDARLVLLDGTDDGVKAWGAELPVRLQQMHSHWYCASRAAVVLRPKLFSQRSVHFLLVLQTQAFAWSFIASPKIRNFAGVQDGSGWLCFRVPEHEADLGWLSLCSRLDTMDQLVLPKSSKIMNVLRKFEYSSGLVHTYYAAPNGTLVFELPRFDLSFELDETSIDYAGRFRSRNFIGFVLAGRQQLRDTLHDVTRYLVLEKPGQTLVIVPAGTVDRTDKKVGIRGNTSCSADRRFHVYELHPRFYTLEAKAGPTAIEARLQLAALYAAAATEVPEACSKQTGGEVAMELVRQSWTSRPMAQVESRQLASIPPFCQLTPALPLLCGEVDACAHELRCLYPGLRAHPAFATVGAQQQQTDAATEYKQRKQRGQLNLRALLNPDEERRVLGRLVSARLCGTLPTAGGLNVPHYASSTADILRIEARLRSMLLGETPTQPEPFPLEEEQDNELGKQYAVDLKESWAAHQRCPVVSLAGELVQLEKDLNALEAQATTLRERAERHLLLFIDRIPESAGWHASAFVMRRACNLEPRVTVRDLARAAWQPAVLRQFNPFLSDDAEEALHEVILEWLVLCVLEDKLERMAILAAQRNTHELERELKEVGRDWSVSQHPQWLVFEVEQRLQIRHMQYRVADFLIRSPGAITQLNMGEGKTRVILPMLLLHMAQPDRLVRLHFLSQLLFEAYHYLHRHLTASLMCRRLLLLPFHRDVKPTVQDVETMHDCLMRCMLARGAVCVAPEHRLSLNLKWHELRLAGAQELTACLPSLDALPYCDLLDESDEILHHRYQLIYARGSNVRLPAGKERWVAVQEILRVLQTSPGVASLLKLPDVAKRLPSERGAGAFDDLRLLPGPALDGLRMKLLTILTLGLLENPPHEMRWLRTIDKALRNIIITFVTEPQSSLAWLVAQPGAAAVNELQRNQLLALRGLLALGLLEHCLSRRHSVDYGVDKRRGVSRRVAVPYSASDTPKERAEYAHPDTLIILTQLSYYHSGISRAELKEAVQVLLTLGPKAQEAHYKLWLDSASTSMISEELSKLDAVTKLDIESEVQLDLLHKVYGHNMAAIDYWLSACVLPRETMQFPKRLVANAFNLTDNGSGGVIGFSGTKDNRRLLPLQVEQRVPDDAEELLATDGKMCGLILQNDEVRVVDTSELKLSESVLRLAVADEEADALIDAGATMAGLSNSEVAVQVIKLLPPKTRLQGCVYYNTSKSAWYVRNRRGRTYPLSSSPIHEKDAFVYFDESRCRGADMKLEKNARGMLTVGPEMGKDKLMQAAGRFRKLDRGQALIFAVPPELESKIRDDDDDDDHHHHHHHQDEDMDSEGSGEDAEGGGLSSRHLLQWVAENTVRATEAGLLEYSSQASHFCMTQDPKARLLDETYDLAELYGGAVGEENVADVVERKLDSDRRRAEGLGVAYTETSQQLSAAILARARTLGSDLRVYSTGVEEECERELENARELEREREVQLPKHAPVRPAPWNFAQLLDENSPLNFGLAGAGIMPLREAVEKYLDGCLAAIAWDQCAIYVSRSFAETVTDSNGVQLSNLSEFMRPPDALVVFPDSSVLLLSEWEADQVLELMWNAPSKPFFANLTYLQEAADKGTRSVRMSVGAAKWYSLRSALPCVKDVTIAGLQLLAGETMFATDERKRSVAELVTPTPAARMAALQLVCFRGRQNYISRSDLELICNADIGEA